MPKAKLIMLIIAVLFYGYIFARIVRLILMRRRRPDLSADKRKELREETRDMIRGWLFVMGIMTFLYLALWYSKHSKDFLERAAQLLGSSRAHGFAGLIALVLGGAAYWFKRTDQYRYGFVEIVFGVLAGGIASSYISVDNFYATVGTYIGSVYVVSRGFNNVADGTAKEQKRKALKKAEERRKDFFDD